MENARSANPTVAAIIPARGGSKGIPRKNLVPLCGRPLIAYTIRAALESRSVTETFVTSDCAEILAAARQAGAQTIRRPDALATDEASCEAAVLHALDFLRDQRGYAPEVIVLLQPTSPLRQAGDIDEAFAHFRSSGADALISGTEPESHPLKQMLVAADGTLSALTDDPTAPFRSRQFLPRAFKPNGAIYIIRTDSFRRTGLFFGERTVPFYMEREKSIDIDTAADLEKAANRMKQNSIMKTCL